MPSAVQRWRGNVSSSVAPVRGGLCAAGRLARSAEHTGDRATARQTRPARAGGRQLGRHARARSTATAPPAAAPLAPLAETSGSAAGGGRARHPAHRRAGACVAGSRRAAAPRRRPSTRAHRQSSGRPCELLPDGRAAIRAAVVIAGLRNRVRLARHAPISAWSAQSFFALMRCDQTLRQLQRCALDPPSVAASIRVSISLIADSKVPCNLTARLVLPGSMDGATTIDLALFKPTSESVLFQENNPAAIMHTAKLRPARPSAGPCPSSGATAASADANLCLARNSVRAIKFQYSPLLHSLCVVRRCAS